jgi:hypothetical protein
MNMNAIYELVCTHENHAFNVPGCIKDMSKCVSQSLSRRILLSYDKSVVYYSAIKECSLREPVYKKEIPSLKLSFKDIDDKERWLVWYLDKGGEEQSEFIVENWQWNTLYLEDDSRTFKVVE